MFLSDIPTNFGRGPDKGPRDPRDDKGKSRKQKAFTSKDRTMLIAGGIGGSALTAGGVALSSQFKPRKKKANPARTTAPSQPVTVQTPVRPVSSSPVFNKVEVPTKVKVAKRVIKRNRLGLAPISESPILNKLKALGKRIK